MDKPNRINRILLGLNPLLYLIPVVIAFITHPQTPQTRHRSLVGWDRLVRLSQISSQNLTLSDPTISI